MRRYQTSFGQFLLVSFKRNCPDRKSTRLNSSHANISYAVFCLKKQRGSRSARTRRAGAQRPGACAAGGGNPAHPSRLHRGRRPRRPRSKWRRRALLFFNDTATPEIYTLSLHDALPISARAVADIGADRSQRGGEHSSRRTRRRADRKSTRLNSSHTVSSYAVFCL